MVEKKKRYLFDGLRDGRWIRCWSEGRGRNKEIAVQIWNSGVAEGDPDGDWGMPGVLGVVLSIDQAVLQTPIEKKN